MTHSDDKIGFIGGGNMALAIVSGLLRAGHSASAIQISEPDAGRRQALAELHGGLQVGVDNDAVASATDILVLAVKPQVLPAVAKNLHSRPAGQLVISIAAGIRLDSLSRWLGDTAAIVRVMPNQPALVGAGMSVLIAGENVTDHQREKSRYVLAAAGETGWVSDEALIDAVTAISGSGPAYFYLLMEMLENTAQEMGVEPELAARLARQTAFGAGLTARDTQETPARLRAAVTSPGGTTAAAIESLEKSDIRAIFSAALHAARHRSLELGRTSSDD